MPNFAPLGWLDTFDLAASLQTRWGAFREPDQYRRRNLHIGKQTVAKWPEMRALLAKVKAGAGSDHPLEFGAIWLQLFPPDYCGQFERIGPSDVSRVYLALRWNPQAVLFSGAESWVLQPGIVTLINHMLPCSALNMGETNAVALVVDSRRKEGQ